MPQVWAHAFNVILWATYCEITNVAHLADHVAAAAAADVRMPA